MKAATKPLASTSHDGSKDATRGELDKKIPRIMEINPVATSTEKNKQKKKKKPTKPTNPPEQKLGDTPVAPWEMPTPEEKAQAKPIRKALKEAVAKVDSAEKAEQVMEHLEKATAGQTAEQVQQTQPEKATPAETAKKVEKAAKTAPESKKTEKVLKETAKALTSPDKRQREIVSEAAQEVLNPEQQGAPTVGSPQQREYLRHAVLRRLKPLDAVDANLFLAVNHLPHTPLLNKLFYGLTAAFSGGTAWFVTMGISALFKRWKVKDALRDAALPLFITNVLVELPIKAYFRRKRPFITIIQAIVIGKKPGNWSFPSGHSATAFGGAWLLGQKFPRQRGLMYTIASLVAFSRIYLGDHYPGDVASGSLMGLLFSMVFHRLLPGLRRKR
jgi:undecaprenyl-diphosphatase